MSQTPPQTLSFKRKRNDPPVDALTLELSFKKHRGQTPDDSPKTASRSSSNGMYYRLVSSQNNSPQQSPSPSITKPNETPQKSLPPSTPTSERRFRIDPLSKRVLLEATERAHGQHVDAYLKQHAPVQEAVPEEPPRRQKRPGAGSAIRTTAKVAPRQDLLTTEPPDHVVREFENLSTEVEKGDNPKSRLPASPSPASPSLAYVSTAIPSQVSPSKYKPKKPLLRGYERHPEKAAVYSAMEAEEKKAKEAAEAAKKAREAKAKADEEAKAVRAAQPMALHIAAEKAEELAVDFDAMEIDEYVTDHYEIVMPDADGNILQPTGNMGVIEVDEGYADWFDVDEEESDKEFGTDDDDENAEEYYANDYPEDELDEDDEYDRDLYQQKFRAGSDDEDDDFPDEDEDDAVGSDEDEDDAHFKMTVPKVQHAGYWGKA
jgi:hypothetical protein